MVLSLSYPIAQSFEWRITYYKKWKYLFPAILIMCAIFIPWDIIFTSYGVWSFNDRYTSGIKIFLLPIEEWLFFIVVPFACVFLYEVLIYFIKKDYLYPITTWVFAVLSVLLLTFAIVNITKIYTSLTFFLTAIALIITVYFNPHWKGRFLMMYLVSWIPFLILNGALTGNFTEEAVVNYNPSEFMGIRITTIPLEDSIYSLLMLLIVVSVYEWLKNRSLQASEK
jgi:lycopene cyclase domain-containing protein